MKLIFSIIVILTIFLNPLNVGAEEIVLAGGCFWCLEHDLESLMGVNSVKSGYSGGDLINPSYENHIGHQEVVLVDYEPEIVSLDDIFRLYLRNIDPLDGNGQFCDRGDSYRPIIFYKNSVEEKKANNALDSAALELSVIRDRIKVELKPKDKFWIAEDYHQDYALKNSVKYKIYRYACGRDKRLDQLWAEKARKIDFWSE